MNGYAKKKKWNLKDSINNLSLTDALGSDIPITRDPIIRQILEDIDKLHQKLIDELCFEFILDYKDDPRYVEITQKIIYEVLTELFGVTK